MEEVSAAHPKHRTAPLGQELVQESHGTAALCWGAPAVLWGTLLTVLCSLHSQSALCLLSELQWLVLQPSPPCCSLSMERCSWRLNREPALHSPKRYQLQFNIIFFLLLFFLLFPCDLWWNPFEHLFPSTTIFSGPLWLQSNSLQTHWAGSARAHCCAGWAGIELFSNGKAQSPAWITWKRHATTSPKVTASLILPLLFIPIHFGGWISTGKTSPGNGWVFVQRKGQMCFSAGFTFQGVTFCDLFCRLSLLFEATVLCFSPDVPGNVVPYLLLILFVTVSSDTPFLHLLAGIF